MAKNRAHLTHALWELGKPERFKTRTMAYQAERMFDIITRLNSSAMDRQTDIHPTAVTGT